MSYPKTSKVRNEKKDKVEMRFLTEKFELILDREKCTGCLTCVRVCPKDAFIRSTPEGPKSFFGKQVIYKRQYSYIPFIHDPSVCVFCGLCSYCCPFDALKLKKNDEIIDPEEIKLAELEAIPKLNYKEVPLENGNVAKVYTEGSLSINTAKCNTGCTNCADICPSGAIKVSPDITREEISFEKNIKIEIFEDDCLYCGACKSICPTDALQLKIDEVKFSGNYNSPFWDEIVERIKKLEREED
jgi:4Fe-4S ferredoxin